MNHACRQLDPLRLEILANSLSVQLIHLGIHHGKASIVSFVVYAGGIQQLRIHVVEERAVRHHVDIVRYGQREYIPPSSTGRNDFGSGGDDGGGRRFDDLRFFGCLDFGECEYVLGSAFQRSQDEVCSRFGTFLVNDAAALDVVVIVVVVDIARLRATERRALFGKADGGRWRHDGGRRAAVRSSVLALFSRFRDGIISLQFGFHEDGANVRREGFPHFGYGFWNDGRSVVVVDHDVLFDLINSAVRDVDCVVWSIIDVEFIWCFYC